MPLDRPPPALPPIVLRAVPGADDVLTPEALAFIGELQGRFGLRLHALMVARGRRQERIDRGELPDYLPQTREIRQGIWRAADIPDILEDRRVEITGPVDRKMMIKLPPPIPLPPIFSYLHTISNFTFAATFPSYSTSTHLATGSVLINTSPISISFPPIKS